MQIRADKRSIHAQREPEADQAARDGLAALRDMQLRLARAFARIEASAHFVFSGCASTIEWAVKQGYSPFEARTLLGLGKTITFVDGGSEAEARVRSGELTVEAASAVGRILANPELVPGPAGSDQEGWGAKDWIDTAQKEPFQALKRRIKTHIEMHAQQETGLEEISVVVTSKTKDDFTRACEVARQKARTSLSEGQVFHRVVNFYLDANDPLRAKEGTRRLGDTNDRPGDPQDPATRYIPAAVRRAIWQRAGGTCEVPGCGRRHGLELAHRVPHAKGSAREVCDLGLLCHRHHLLYDAGRIPWPLGVGSVGGGSVGGGSVGGGSVGVGPVGVGPPSRDSARRRPRDGSALGSAGGGEGRVCEPRARWLAFPDRTRAAV